MQKLTLKCKVGTLYFFLVLFVQVLFCNVFTDLWSDKFLNGLLVGHGLPDVWFVRVCVVYYQVYVVL